MLYGIDIASQKLVLGVDIHLFSAFLDCPYKALMLQTATSKVDDEAYEFVVANQVTLAHNRRSYS